MINDRRKKNQSSLNDYGINIYNQTSGTDDALNQPRYDTTRHNKQIYEKFTDRTTLSSKSICERKAVPVPHDPNAFADPQQTETKREA